MPDPVRMDDPHSSVGKGDQPDRADAEHGTLGSEWIAKEIARAQAQDAAALERQAPERVSPGAALAASILASVLLWGLAIGIGVGAVLILADQLGRVR